MAAQATEKNSPEEYAPIIIDLGRYKRKRVRRLRRGKSGRLLDKVQDCVDELKTSGQIADSAQPVVIVVREKRKKRKRWRW